MISVLFAESGNFKTSIKAVIVDAVLATGAIVFDYSPEDGCHLLASTRLARETGIPYANIYFGDLDDDQRARLEACRPADAGNHYVLDADEQNNRIDDIERECRAAPRLDFVVIDYAQMLDFSAELSQNQAVSGMENAVKRMQTIARELNIAVLIVSQISRDRLGSRKDKRPLMRDLFGSSYLEFGSKLAIALYRPWKHNDEAYGDNPGPQYPGIVEIWVRKNRFGPIDVHKKVVIDLPTGIVSDLDEDPGVSEYNVDVPF